MLCRATSSSYWTSATSAKHLPFGQKQNGDFDPPPNHLTSLLVTFYCSQGRIRIWKVGVLLMWQRFNENCWRPLTAFPLKVLDNVSSSGSGAGIAASGHWGAVLWRWLKFQTCTNVLNKFFNNSRNIWVLLHTYICYVLVWEWVLWIEWRFDESLKCISCFWLYCYCFEDFLGVAYCMHFRYSCNFYTRCFCLW